MGSIIGLVGKKELHKLINDFLENQVWTESYFKKKKVNLLKDIEEIDSFLDKMDDIGKQINIEHKKLLKKYYKSSKDHNTDCLGLFKSFKKITGIKCNMGAYLFLLNKYGKD